MSKIIRKAPCGPVRILGTRCYSLPSLARHLFYSDRNTNELYKLLVKSKVDDSKKSEVSSY